MVGREITRVRKETVRSSGRVILNVKNIGVWDGRGVPAVRRVSFSMGKGETVGTAGVEGNGQKGLVEAIARIRLVAERNIWLNG